MIQDPVALLAFMFGVIAIARIIEDQFAFVKKISSAVLCTLLGILLSNAGVLPYDSPVQQGIYTYAVPYTIVLVILSSKLRDLRIAGRTLVYCFFLACVGSLIGGIIAGLIFEPWLGPETWKLAGQFAAAFSGGGMNFVAVGRALETSPSLFAAAAVVDNMSTVPWMLAQVALAAGLGRFFLAVPATGARPLTPAEEPLDATRPIDGDDHPNRATPTVVSQIPNGSDEAMDPRLHWTRTVMTLTDLAVLGALPLAGLYLSRQLTAATGFPEVLWLSTLALIAAQIPIVQRLNGAAVLSVLRNAPLLHRARGLVDRKRGVPGRRRTVRLHDPDHRHSCGDRVRGRMALKFDLQSVTIASQATVGGPGSALALAMSLNWGSITTPGVIIGVFGYAIGNYVGFATSYLLRAMQ